MRSRSSTIVELARHCKTSVATVSRVFSGKVHVNPVLRERVLTAARELNYAPQQTSRKDNVAIIIPPSQSIRPPSWYANMLIATIIQETTAAGMIPQLIEFSQIDLLYPNFTVAALILDWRERAEVYQGLTRKGIPTIGINMKIPGGYMVCTDHYQSAKQALLHLYEHGHRKIGWLDAHTNNWGSAQRMQGYLDALKECSIDFDERMICAQDATAALALDGLADVLHAGATALVCLHEDWVIQLNYYLQALRYKVPEDISVIAAEIPSLCQWMMPPWTTVEQDLQKLALNALELIPLLANGSLPVKASAAFKVQPIPNRLIERRSVAQCHQGNRMAK
jgi:LacI family transcriptional regulator